MPFSVPPEELVLEGSSLIFHSPLASSLDSELLHPEGGSSRTHTLRVALLHGAPAVKFLEPGSGSHLRTLVLLLFAVNKYMYNN